MKKPLLALFAVSLAANAALLVVVLKKSSSHPSFNSKESAPNSEAGARSPSPSKNEPLTEEQMRGLALTADILATTDLPTLVSRLRAAGFPTDIIRGIISAHIARDFGARRKAVVAHQETIPFWKPSLDTFPTDPKAGAEINRLIREQAKQLKQLLGADARPDDDWSQLLRERRLGYLPVEKADQIQEITSDYTDMRTQVYIEARGMMLPEDQAKIALIEKEQRADLVSLLTPEELENYDLRTSNEARSLRYQLAGFDPTEEEFRAIYRIQKDFQDKFASVKNGQATPQAMQEMQRAQQQLPAQIQAALSPDRAAAYTQSTEPVYQQTTQVLTRLNLPLSLAPQIVDLQKDLSQRATDLQKDTTLTADDRSQQLAALQTEAQTKLTATLGERGYQIYKSQGGYWLMNLAPRSQKAPMTIRR